MFFVRIVGNNLDYIKDEFHEGQAILLSIIAAYFTKAFTWL